MKIHTIKARQILDSRGNPTVEADVILENGILGRAAVPSGASTGKFEAVELRDNDAAHFGGNGVLKAVNNVQSELSHAVVGMDVEDQTALDTKMIELDGTENKSRLGANAILAVSLAASHAAALDQQIPLFQYFRNLVGVSDSTFRMPIPMINIVNGGRHAAGSTDIQEFMIMPTGADCITNAVEIGAEVFHALADVLKSRGYGTTVGDEGGFAPHVKNGNEEALELIATAIEKANYTLGKDIHIALDVASSEFYDGITYNLKTENKQLNRDQMIDWLNKLSQNYPIISIEDGLAQDDWEGWKQLTTTLGDKLQLVGDDLLVTNIKFLEKAINEKAGNAILIKLNQIGTVTETLKAVQMAKTAGWNSVISHRSGETEDISIAHLAVGLNTGLIKTGSMSRSERTAKYNELMRIEEILGEKAVYRGNIRT